MPLATSPRTEPNAPLRLVERWRGAWSVSRVPKVITAVVLAVALAGLVLALGAHAVIPAANKVSDELARSNRAARRAEPLIFDVKLRIGDGAELATGVLATHPTGLARLELRVALEELHRRIPDYRIEPGKTPRFSPGIREVQYLPLTWDAA